MHYTLATALFVAAVIAAPVPNGDSLVSLGLGTDNVDSSGNIVLKRSNEDVVKDLELDLTALKDEAVGLVTNADKKKRDIANKDDLVDLGLGGEDGDGNIVIKRI